MTFVVVGGDAAGMSAASKARRENPDLEVVVFEKGQWVSYGACGLPYYIKGEIQSLESLVSVTPEEFREERDIDLRTGHEVVGIDGDARTVTARSDDGEVTVGYDHLLLATGAGSVVPPIEGRDREGVYTLGSMTDGASVAVGGQRQRDVVRFARDDVLDLRAVAGGVDVRQVRLPVPFRRSATGHWEKATALTGPPFLFCNPK